MTVRPGEQDEYRMTTLNDLRGHRATEPDLPRARGPLTEALLAHLRCPVHELGPLPDAMDDAIDGDDRALALYVMYELHYRSFAGVDDGWEWETSLLRERARLERAFAARLLQRVPHVPVAPESVTDTLVELANDRSGPSLSQHMADAGTLEQMREFAVHRSAYQRKEADPHTWAVPRLTGRTKAALVDIQRGEYGDGVPDLVHAELFATTMEALGLDPAYGAYLDRIPGTTLATSNLISLFGLHRRWRGALVGHLARFEMSSVVPMGRYRDAMYRLGVGDGAPFYEVHVEADARHEVVALHDMAGALVEDEPDLAADIVFGARALDALERSFATRLLDAWAAGKSSLLPPR
jgi:hypothetical protein